MDPIARLERVGDATWPALSREWYDGWLLRFAAGVTGRSNSANPVAQGALRLADKVAHVERRFREEGIRCLFRLTPLADPGLDDLLTDLGYGDVVGADVMTRSLSLAPIDAPDLAHQHPRVEAGPPSPAWLSALSMFGDDRGRPQVMREIMEAIAVPSGYATFAVEERIVAIGMAAVADGVVAVYNMSTEPGHRRTGLGRAVLASLLQWGREQGAEEAMLQVRPDNPAAQAMYRGAGFVTTYSYTYRRQGSASSPSAG